MKVNKNKISGFTLIELVISILIISVALTGTLLAFKTATVNSADPMVMQQAISIGKSYLEEILSKDFPSTLLCPSPPLAGRSEYANVCDYSSLSDTGARDQNGNAISGLNNYTVQVSLDTSSAVLGSLISGTDVIRVDVSILHTQIPTVILSGYKTNY